jgi:crotonobetainyl-CoA:carnitine CoA-transferase CaiB-like acyl-CoA transferase
MADMDLSRPLRGLRVVEVSLGVSVMGAGLAGSLPGTLFRDLGAEVIRVQSKRRPALDAGVEFARVWNRGKQVVDVDDENPPRAAETIAAAIRDADVAIIAGSENLVERRGLGYQHLAQDNPRLVVARVRPSCNALGATSDLVSRS